VMAGKRVDLSPTVGAFSRSIGGDVSPEYLEEALQLVYLLFMQRTDASDEELVRSVKQMTIESIRARMRDPQSRFSSVARFLNYACHGSFGRRALSQYFQSLSIADVRRVAASSAVAFHDACFASPAEWHLLLVGALPEAGEATKDPNAGISACDGKVEALVTQWLGGITARDAPATRGTDWSSIPGAPPFNPPLPAKAVVPLATGFPLRPAYARVRAPMVDDQAQVQISLPLLIERDERGSAATESLWVALLSRVLERRLLRELRFRSGNVYSVAVRESYSTEPPGQQTRNIRGDLVVAFSCDPADIVRLTEVALSVIATVQHEPGPAAAEDLQTALEVETRNWENAQQENGHWIDQISKYYQSPLFTECQGDLDEIHRQTEAHRVAHLAAATADGLKDAALRVLHSDAVGRNSPYTVVTLMPARPLWHWRRFLLFDAITDVVATSHRQDHALILGVIALSAGVAVCSRYLRRPAR